ncbi:hypothetical protein TIFTF001_018780 [Ficus carica]|uniref:Uncharacterized protein n=1 Tax=Ficus carica TaxID=3494 RepID=A0AA88DJA4_FICCA|nr:hypothetical protein TIFTF001_018780 [Ficus carica]
MFMPNIFDITPDGITLRDQPYIIVLYLVICKREALQSKGDTVRCLLRAFRCLSVFHVFGSSGDLDESYFEWSRSLVQVQEASTVSVQLNGGGWCRSRNRDKYNDRYWMSGKYCSGQHLLEVLKVESDTSASLNSLQNLNRRDLRHIILSNLTCLLASLSNFGMNSRNMFKYVDLWSLKIVNLCYSKKLVNIANLSWANLKSLDLEGCTSLVEIPSRKFEPDIKREKSDCQFDFMFRCLPGQIEQFTLIMTFFLNLSGCSNLKTLSKMSGNIEHICLLSIALEELDFSTWSLD